MIGMVLRGAAGRGLVSRLLLGTALAVGVVPISGMFGGAFAQSADTHNINLPVQPLGRSLRQLADQTGVQIAYGSAVLGDRNAPIVAGTMSTEQALTRLLAGKGLSYRFTGANTVTILSAPSGAGGAAAGGAAVAEPGATVLDTINVTTQGGGSVNHIEISAEELEQKRPTDLQELFADEPKVSVGGSFVATQKVYVQGIEETNLAVTVDGSRQNNKVFHHNSTNLIDPTLLKAVGVDAGVAPADAGPGALAGSIAYETKDARDLLDPGARFGGFATSSYDTNSHTFATGLSTYGATDGFDYLGYLNFARGDNYKAGNGQVVDGTSADLLSGLLKFAYEGQNGYRFEVSHEQVRDDAPRPFRANIGMITGRPAWEPRVRDYKLDRRNTVFTFTDTTPEGWWDPTILFAYSRADVETLVTTRVEQFPATGTTESFNGKAENRFALDMGSVTAGFDFYNDKALLDANYDASAEKASNAGFYAQARIEPFDRTRLSFGGRGDHQWFTGTRGEEWENSGLSGNISGEYDLMPEFLTAKAGYSHVWAGVPLAENFIMNPLWNYRAGPEPVTADNYTAGLVATYEAFTLEGNIFRTDIYDARSARYAVNRAIEAHDIRSEGFDISGRYSWGAGYVSIKYADIDVNIDGLPADTDIGTYLATPVGQIFTVAAVHNFAEWGLTVGGDVEIALDYDDVAPGNKPLEGYQVVNAFVEYEPPSHPNFTLRGEVRNIFDETYANRATYGQEFGTVQPLLEPGRTFRISATAKF
ncbi:hemoglobin/transferrin/lactoferrin receptor protein [Mesorhizobium albiziae]|uniref:Hemoglobin/transferrin/lactoferrin receptor protein n=1 Tax=Neomesorhizobium albiziae TaxID=335020 RepID=A0A1I4AHL0_9HYPH|nr:TonB-dependent receptor [Mesorhizobium albiziae]SFK55952.1 hemoglobin/transferrin/lactoferrin receptor protein [Mesorhizobium albiziae]